MNGGSQSFFQTDLDKDSVFDVAGGEGSSAVALLIGTPDNEEHITLHIHHEGVFDKLEAIAAKGRQFHREKLANATNDATDHGSRPGGSGPGDPDA